MEKKTAKVILCFLYREFVKNGRKEEAEALDMAIEALKED